MMHRHTAFGLGFLALLVLVGAATVGSYRGSFRDTVEIHAVTGRAGLTLEKGGQVKFRGLKIGTVTAVHPDGDEVTIDMRIDRKYVDSTPADVTAQIIPPTAFGAKYVQLTAAAEASDARLREGQTIRVDHVGTEVNTAFSNLSTVLEVAQPRDVAGAVSAVAGAVDGQGERLGGLMRDLNGYLKDFDGTLPALEADISLGRDVLAEYNAAAPDISALSRNSVTINAALRRREEKLDALLTQLDGASTVADRVVADNTRQLAELLGLVEPVALILARYSPELPCVVKGAARDNVLAEAVVGGNRPGISTYTELQPPASPYTHPRNLPRVGDRRGPGCYGLPSTSGSAEWPATDFATGVSRADHGRQMSGDETFTGVFGVLAEAVIQ